MLCVLVGALCWSICNVLIKKHQPKNLLSFIVWSSLFAAFPLFMLSYFLHGTSSFVGLLNNLNFSAIFSILFQSYITTILGYSIWSMLIKKYPAAKVAPLSLLVPIFGFLTAFFMFNEVISTPKIIGSIMVLMGLTIFLCVKKHQNT